MSYEFMFYLIIIKRKTTHGSYCIEWYRSGKTGALIRASISTCSFFPGLLPLWESFQLSRSSLKRPPDSLPSKPVYIGMVLRNQTI